MTPPTLVLVHGAGCDHHAWDDLRAHLPDALAPDLPGRGTNPGPACTSASSAAQAVLAVLAARAVPSEGAIIVGHSYGGAVAIECALAAPLAGLVLISTGARLRVHPLVLAAMRTAAAASERTAASIGWLPGRPRDDAARFDAHASRVPSSTTLTDWSAADTFDRLADVARIAAPTLVIGGTEDELTPPKYARYLAAQIPSAELVMLEGAGHMCIVEDAARVAALLRAR